MAVFDTVELLESVLVLLPYEDVWRLTRVSNQWQTVILKSTILRQAMMLNTIPTPQREVTDLGTVTRSLCFDDSHQPASVPPSQPQASEAPPSLSDDTLGQYTGM